MERESEIPARFIDSYMLGVHVRAPAILAPASFVAATDLSSLVEIKRFPCTALHMKLRILNRPNPYPSRAVDECPLQRGIIGKRFLRGS